MGMRTSIFLVVSGCLISPATLPAAGVPPHWEQLGSVQEWSDTDHRRGHWALGQFWETDIVFDGDQQEIYRKTFTYTQPWPQISLTAWSELGPGEQRARRDAAVAELEYVVRFRLRLLRKDNKWTKSGDIDVLSECLGRLHVAVGLDPSNAYAWNLLGYFSACVGDTRRAAAAYAEVERALDLLGEGSLVGVRRRLALETAWLRRDLGDFGRTLKQVEIAEAHGGEDTETRILRGLIAAQTGDELEAMARADQVGHIEVGRRHGYGFREAPSDFARSWIVALLWLHLGDDQTARGAFREYDFEDRYPPYAHHFWRDAAGIYRRTGRPDLAQGGWRVANFWIPFRPFFVDKRYGWDDSELTGLEGGSMEYCAFDQFFISGDRLAFASRYATVMQEVRDTDTKMALAAVALEHVEICKRTGYLPGHAHLVGAMVYQELDDLDTARYELRSGKKWLREHGLAMPAVSAGTEVVVIRGTSGRYDEDPDRTLEVLTAAWNQEHSETNRQALGVFLIRHGNPRQGRELLLRDREDVDPLTLPAEELCQLLEADRALEDQRLAGHLVAELATGRDDLPADSQVWALAAFCFIDQGDRQTGRAALARAVELDPDNPGLRMQLRILEQ